MMTHGEGRHCKERSDEAIQKGRLPPVAFRDSATFPVAGPTRRFAGPGAAMGGDRVRTDRRRDAAGLRVGSESAAGVALSQKLSSADFTSLSAEKYPSCHVSSAARKCQALFLSAFNQ